MEIEVKIYIRGHHMYSTIWTPVLGELLSCKRELDNAAKDRYVVAVCIELSVSSLVTFQRKYHFFV